MKTYEQFTKVRYSCVLLNEESQSILKSLLCDELSNDWTIYCHHMTICLGELPQEFKYRIGEEINLKVFAVGQDEKAYAVRVNPIDKQLEDYYKIGAKSGPKFPHITLAVNPINGGKPVMSNNIQDWIPIDELFNEEILLMGKITEIKN